MIGLDIGGTKTRGVRFEDGTPVADESVGSSNVQNVSPEEAARNLAELFARIGGGAVAQVYAGAGGIDTDDDAAALAALIAPHVPGARITVVHDSRLLLAAGGASTGVAVIAGTGSAAWGKNGRGEEARAGGWGYLLGDEGSGYWLGREAVRHSLRRMNQGLEPDELTTRAAGILRRGPPEHADRTVPLARRPDAASGPSRPGSWWRLRTPATRRARPSWTRPGATSPTSPRRPSGSWASRAPSSWAADSA